MGNRDDGDAKLHDFRPRIGRTDRARERVASSPLRVATLVRRGHGRLGGKGAARLPPTAGFGPRQSARRVVVKAHVQKLGGHGAQAAARHLRYISRVARDGTRRETGAACAPPGARRKASRGVTILAGTCSLMRTSLNLMLDACPRVPCALPS